MATTAQLRTGIKRRLETIAGLHVTGKIPDTLRVPCVITKRIASPPPETFDGFRRTNFELKMIVQLSTVERAQDSLDEYTQDSGSKSIEAALLGDESLGGYADFLNIGEWGEDTAVTYGEDNNAQYLEATMILGVYHS